MDTRALEGREVVAATQQLRLQDDGVVDALLFLRLHFTDGSAVRLGCASDGQSLRLDEEPLETYRMPELHSGSGVREFDPLPRGAIIDAAEPLIDDDDVVFGVLLTAGNRRVFVFNWGDELFAGNDLPDAVRRGLRRSLPL